MSKLASAMKALKKNKEIDIDKALVDLTDSQKPIPCIPTGSVVLDYLIGGYKTASGEKRCPGIPRGRITEIFGPEGSGKCTTLCSVVLTEYGMMTIGELFEKEGYALTDEEKVVPHEVRLVNELGEFESTSHFTFNGRQTVKKIRTRHGFELEATLNHPIRVVDPETGLIVWKNTEDIVPGDQVVLMRGNETLSGGISVSEPMNPDVARFIGYLVAEGTITQETSTQFSNSVPEIIEDFTRCLTTFDPDQTFTSYPRKESKGIQHTLSGRKFRTRLAEEYGLDYVISKGKSVPLCVRTGGIEAQKAFLKSYIDCECHIDVKKRCLEITSASKELLHQVQLMLMAMGILSIRNIKVVKGYEHNEYWRLNLGYADVIKYEALIGFVSQQRKDSFAEFSTKKANSNSDSYPHSAPLLKAMYENVSDTGRSDYKVISDYKSGKANPSMERIAQIVDKFDDRGNEVAQDVLDYFSDVLSKGYVFSEVTEVLEEHDVPTFDVCLPETHSFWSNGFISHNTTIAIQAAIRCQAAGGSVVFLDYEHAFAPTYAQDLGLNVEDGDTFMLLAPRHWEEGAEIIQTMVRAGVDLIIVDSLAAMKPKRDVEDNAVTSTGQVGHIARLQSNFLPKIVGDIEENGTSLVYINQLRSRIKTSKYDGGPDEETSGGRALKYFASLRLSLKRVKTEYAQVENELTGKSEKQPISNMIRAKNVKNKVSKHQGHQAEFVIRYGEGIDNVRSVIDIGEVRKVVKRAGAWYSFLGADGLEVKAQGKEGLRDHLIENPSDFNALVEKVQSFSKKRVVLKVSDDDILEQDHEAEEAEYDSTN